MQPATKKAVAGAQRFLADASTAMGAYASDVGKGHAPTTQQLWRRSALSRNGPLSGEAERSAAASASAPRVWAWRWRRRWFFKCGKFRTSEQYDVQELRRQVAARGVEKKTRFWVQQRVPKLGPESDPRFGSFCAFPNTKHKARGPDNNPQKWTPKIEKQQVLVTWRWARWLASRPGPTPLFVNLDETGVLMFLGDMHGNVARPACAAASPMKDVTQNVTRRLLRSQVRHVAIICGDASAQLLLHQVLIGDKSILPVGLQCELQADAPRNVTV